MIGTPLRGGHEISWIKNAMNVSRKIIFFAAILCALLSPYRVAVAQEPTPTSAPLVGPDPVDIINAVNSTRLAYGLRPLAVHPVLMQVAQHEANGIASGMPGHWRPEGMTLGQWLLVSGYPLSGDLSLDGYRSENWVAADSLEQAMAFWLSDASHTDTILSAERSDLGVGVAVSDQIYMVLETALQTNSGKMQSDAAAFLTSIPMTQAAYSVNATQVAANGGDASQYVLPVAINTALPNGDVYHEVEYGQTLWSIAVRYNTTIKQIQQLNNLSSTTVVVGQKLLVLNGVTAPAPSIGITSTPVYSEAAITMLPTVAVPPTYPIEDVDQVAKKNDSEGMIYGIAAIAISALFMGGVFTAVTRKKPI